MFNKFYIYQSKTISSAFILKETSYTIETVKVCKIASQWKSFTVSDMYDICLKIQ